MKILVYSINYAPELTGIGKYSGEMVDWLFKRGHEVHVVTAPPYYPQWHVADGYSARKYNIESHPRINLTHDAPVEDAADDAARAGNLVVYRCPLWIPSKPGGLKRILHLASFALTSMPVALSQVPWRPDVVLAIEPPLFCSPAALVVAALARAKALLHVQDYEVDAAFQLGLLRNNVVRSAVLSIERWLMRRFDGISTISYRMIDRLASKGVDENKRILFPNWVNTEQISPMVSPSPYRLELGIGSDDVVLLYSGNMGEKQGLEIVVEAARLLESESRIHFVMCGQGAAYDNLRSMADGLPNIIWIPLQPLERLNELLNLADIHLLPQRADAADLVMPSKLTGIMASGRPVIATANQGTEVWSVVEGRGINTAPGDVSAFVQAITFLANDSTERERLGRSGRTYAIENLSTEAVLEKFELELLRLTNN